MADEDNNQSTENLAEEDNNQRTDNLAEEDSNQRTENVADEENNQRTENLLVQEGSQAGNSREVVLCQAPMKKYSRKGRKERKDCRQTGKAYTTVSGKSVQSRKQIPLTTCRLKALRASKMKICLIYSLTLGLGVTKFKNKVSRDSHCSRKPSCRRIRDDGV